MVTWSRTFRAAAYVASGVVSGILFYIIFTFAGISPRTIEILLSIISLIIGIAIIVLLFYHLRAD